ncbi:ABC transporter ATP-binding protein [Candidatus Sumerlaeota bacterium]|nr:ABC transporter ATP-binding protein [Candidatus Sumerlaeota bacterium]
MMIELKNVSKCFLPRSTKTLGKIRHSILATHDPLRKESDSREVWALRHINLTVNRGESLGLVGSNGCGKSTLLRLIAGITHPTSGTMHVNGRVAGLIELTAGFHEDLSGIENVYLNGAALGMNREKVTALIPAIKEFAEIGHFFYEPVRVYSAGMLLRLGFALAIHANPDILVVDEALAVGDVRFQNKCLERIRKMQADGITLLFVSHASELVESICDTAAWIQDGEIRQQGKASDVLDAYNSDIFKRLSMSERQEYNHLISGLMSGGRFGHESAPLRIRNVRMLNTHGETCHLFHAGATIRVVVSISNNMMTVCDCILAWSLNLIREGAVCKAFSSDMNVVYTVSTGESQVSFEFATDCLLADNYYLNIGLMRPGQPNDPEAMIDSYMNIVRLQIENDGIQTERGMISLPVRSQCTRVKEK